MGAGGAALVLLPLLISGYLFNLIFSPLRYFSERAEGQKLFFMAAGTGLLLGTVTFLLTAAMERASGFSGSPAQAAVRWVNSAIPVDHAYRLLATMLTAVLLACALNVLTSLYYRIKDQTSALLHSSRARHERAAVPARRHRKTRTTAKRVYLAMTHRYGNSLAQLLCRAAANQELVLITLKSRKVYCGRILEAPVDTEREDLFLELLPSFSGYRDKDKLHFGPERTEYPVITLWTAQRHLAALQNELRLLERKFADARQQDPSGIFADARVLLEKQIEEAKSVIASVPVSGRIAPEDWIKVLPVQEIESASLYDPPAYRAWFSGQESAAVPSPSNPEDQVMPVDPVTSEP